MVASFPQPPQDILDHFDADAADFVVETAIARVWKLRRSQAGGDFAALKVYHNADLGGEGPGLNYLAAQNEVGPAAVQLLGRHGRAVLLEWLDGPSLGDLVRAGRRAQADAHLAQVAKALQASPLSPAVAKTLTPVETWCDDLLSLRFAPSCSRALAADMKRA